MKKAVLSILLVCVLLAGQLACSAASYFESFDSVTYVGEPGNAELEEILRQVAEQAKKAVEQNPNLVFYAPEKGVITTQSTSVSAEYYKYYQNTGNNTSLLVKYFATR